MREDNIEIVELNDAEIDAVAGGVDGHSANTGVSG